MFLISPEKGETRHPKGLCQFITVSTLLLLTIVWCFTKVIILFKRHSFFQQGIYILLLIFHFRTTDRGLKSWKILV